MRCELRKWESCTIWLACVARWMAVSPTSVTVVKTRSCKAMELARQYLRNASTFWRQEVEIASCWETIPATIDTVSLVSAILGLLAGGSNCPAVAYGTRRITGEIVVELLDLGHHGFASEVLDESLSSPSPQVAPQIGVGDQPVQRLDQCPHVFGSDQQAAVRAGHLGHPPDLGAHDRDAEHHGFQEDQAEGLISRRCAEDIGVGIGLSESVVGKWACEQDPVFQCRTHPSPELRLVGDSRLGENHIVTDDLELQLDVPRTEGGNRLEQQINALALLEAADKQHAHAAVITAATVLSCVVSQPERTQADGFGIDFQAVVMANRLENRPGDRVIRVAPPQNLC